MPTKPRGKTNRTTVLAARELRRNETEAETILWEALRSRQLKGIRFRRQHPVGHYVLDFFCVKYQLGIEVDGGIHNQPDQAVYDSERTAYLEEHGIRILRFRNEEIMQDLPGLLQGILENLSRDQHR